MTHIPALIQDLALILITAAAVSILFKILKQPVVLGYILAGLLVGPHTHILPTVTDIKNINTWGEIGVIILLFSIGLEFSFKRIAQMGGGVLSAGIVDVTVMLVLGYLTGKLLGWSQMDSIFLGGTLAISSTAIIFRAVDELGMKSRGFVNTVFGILIVEDIVAVLLLVLLTTLAVTQKFEGMDLLLASGKMIFFLMTWFLIGIFAIPMFLRSIKPYMSDETKLVVALGLCLLMVLVANHLGLSAALGAFVMGSLLSETVEGEKIAHLIEPVKNLFSAVFFVSVGMLIQPTVIMNNFAVISIITFVLVVGKFSGNFIGCLLSGQSVKHSVQTGMSLTQIGEFSFIIANLGLTLGVTSEFLYPIIVAVSVLTSFSTPYMIQSSDQVYDYVDRKMSDNFKKRLDQYRQSIRQLGASGESSEIIQAYIFKLIPNIVISLAVILIGSQVLLPWLKTQVEDATLISYFLPTLVLTLAAPFLWAIAFGRIRSLVNIKNPLIYVMQVVRVLIAGFLMGLLVGKFVNTQTALLVTLGLVLLLGVVFAQFLKPIYNWFEKMFLSHLNEKSDLQIKKTKALPMLAPWDAHLADFIIEPSSPVVGKTLISLSVREKFGVTIAMLERGHRKITAPGRDEVLMSFDKIFVIGTDEQLSLFKAELLDVRESQEESDKLSSFSLESVQLLSDSQFVEKTIRDCGIREATNGLIVGLERLGQRYLNPDSQMILRESDLLWIVGDTDKIRNLLGHKNHSAEN